MTNASAKLPRRAAANGLIPYEKESDTDRWKYLRRREGVRVNGGVWGRGGVGHVTNSCGASTSSDSITPSRKIPRDVGISARRRRPQAMIYNCAFGRGCFSGLEIAADTPLVPPGTAPPTAHPNRQHPPAPFCESRPFSSSRERRATFQKPAAALTPFICTMRQRIFRPS